jgi:tRNA (guanine-N7-)-methyltransferase
VPLPGAQQAAPGCFGLDRRRILPPQNLHVDAADMMGTNRVGEGPSRAEQIAARQEAHRRKVETRRAALSSLLARLCLEWVPFSRSVLEIGCGHGHFLTAYAAAYPGEACVGLDFCNQRLQRALRKRDRANVQNLHFVRAEASEFLEALPAGICFSRVYLLFPDPWPKKRHAKYRLMSPDFLSRLAGRITSGGDLLFRSDSAPYFEQAREALKALSVWRLASVDRWPFEQPTVFQEKAQEHHSLVAIRT